MINRPQFLKVEGEAGLVRDTASNAILATNLAEKRAYIERQKREINISKIDQMDRRIENLESNVTNIKEMVEKLINMLGK